MKVLHLIQKPQLRGAEIFASQLASHFIQSGHTAIIVCLFQGEKGTPSEEQLISLNGNPHIRLCDIKAWKNLYRIIKKENPDIIQANAGDTLKYAVSSKIIYRWRQPIVFRNASTISLYIKTWFSKKWNGFFFHFANKIISVSSTSAIDFAKLFPGYRNKITTIPIGIENPYEYNITASKKMNGPQSFGKRPVIIHVGGFTFEKNHSGLIDIFEKLLQKRANASLLLLGDGPLKEKIQEIVHLKGLDTNIIFYGFKKDAIQYINDADVLILPSIIEGLPGVILEAFYCKTPVVAFDVGGIKEILVNNITGRLIPPGDEQSFVKGILDALEVNNHNTMLLKNAYDLVTTKYLNSNIAREFLNVYQSVIK